jgi:DNA replication protein DnaC
VTVEQAADAIWTESLASPDTSYIPDEDRFVTLANGEREELHWRIALARQAFRDRDERMKAQYAIPAHVRCVFCEDSGIVRKRADPLDQPRADGQPCICTAGELRQAHHQAEERWRRMMPKKMHRWTLETCPNHELVVKVYDWFKTDPLKTGRGLVIMGQSGRGKTGAAIGILHYFHAAGSRVYFTAVQELLESTKEGFGFDDKTNLAEHARPLVRAERAHVLVLDDLGAERVTDFSAASIDNLVRKRYNAERPTIITSNLSAQDFRRRVGPRLLSRLAETSQAIVADGPDYRTDRQEDAFTP